MATEFTQAVVDELDQLLDRERQALLVGDLDQIARILALKESLIDRINGLTVDDHTDLGALQDKLSRNQTLLTGAMEGIRAVADRMAELRRVRQGLETYDSSGRKKKFATQFQGSVEKRA